MNVNLLSSKWFQTAQGYKDVGQTKVVRGQGRLQQSITTNTLFYGDNLAIMREYIPDEGVDLVYLQRMAMTLTRMYAHHKPLSHGEKQCV